MEAHFTKHAKPEGTRRASEWQKESKKIRDKLGFPEDATPGSESKTL